MTLGLASCWAADSIASAPDIADASSGQVWSLKLPEGDTVVFTGAPDYDGAVGGTNSMLYPAPNVVGLIAAVITHGLIVESQKSSQRKKAQESADKVLDPYQSILITISYQQLARPWVGSAPPRSGRKLIGAKELPHSDEWLIETEPVFMMAQDRRTLSLDTLVSIHAPGATGDAVNQSHIRVISPALESGDPVDAWAADGGKKLKEVSAWLFSESLKIAMGTAINGASHADSPFRTIRYLEGSAEKMERAQLISEQCGRMVMRTLRGSLMSVPALAPTVTGGNGAKMECAKG